MSGWSGGWGGEGWGGDSLSPSIIPPVTFERALAVSENVIRLYFSAPPYWSGLLDVGDASFVSGFSIVAIAGTTGLDGTSTRPVAVLSTALGTDPNSLDLTLDRPMTPYPSQYGVSINGLVAGTPPATVPIANATVQLFGAYRTIVAPTEDALQPARDFANPQTAVDQTTSSRLLGTYVVDDTGDYAVDEGLTSYKKRILRRLVTRKNGFAHMPGYGVGIPSYGKRLQKASVRAAIAQDAQAQIAQEPETQEVSVTSRQDPVNPGLVYFIIRARTKSGQTTSFAAGPFSPT